MNIIGQDKICKWIKSHNLDSFPRSLMFVGPKGSGKKSLVEVISTHLGLSSIDITERLDLETINSIYDQVTPFIYIINVNDITLKEENIILKFLEEPLKNAYIILLAETENGLLPTIINRCQVWQLNAYTKEDLQQFLTIDNPQILEIAITPGDVITLCSISFNEMMELANKLITKIHIANIPNTLSISEKIAWKGEETKFDFSLFIRVLCSQIRSYALCNPDPKLITLYGRTLTLCKNSYIKNIDKRNLFELYLIDARAIMKGELV